MSAAAPITVVVPVLNEAELAADLGARLAALAGADAVEVVVVDGGSDDATATLLRDAGLTVLPAARGRAGQMNAGAVAAGGQVLLFLHADTRLPDDALAGVRDAVDAGAVWGRFDVAIDGRSRWLPLIATTMNLRSRLTGIATGDQALFVRRRLFEQIGGFPEQPLMEDIELTKRLKGIARPACLRPPVTTSGRRWDRDGAWSTILLMWRLRLAYWRGVPAAELARRYG
ncbi:MAG: TIGR04283 family arsenosugar biosynthesis glycosyltransferase [Pseudomonadota bacterium]